jgi:hypothetical protein
VYAKRWHELDSAPGRRTDCTLAHTLTEDTAVYWLDSLVLFGRIGFGDGDAASVRIAAHRAAVVARN